MRRAVRNADLIALFVMSLALFLGTPARDASAQGWLGVQLETVTPQLQKERGLARASGALVTGVVPGSPASKAGLARGDIIIRIADREVRSADDVSRAAAGLAANAQVRVVVLRGGRETALTATLPPRAADRGFAPSRAPAPAPPPAATDGSTRRMAPERPAAQPAPSPAPVTRAPSPSLGAPAPKKNGAPPDTAARPAAPPAAAPPPAPRMGAPREQPKSAEPPAIPPSAGSPPAATEAEPRNRSYYRTETPDDEPGAGAGPGAAPNDPVAGGAPPPAGGAAPAETEPYTTLTVHYATDRKATQSTVPKDMYQGERGTLVYGKCEVTIPRTHKVGELEAPSLWRFEVNEDPNKHVILKSARQQAVKDFYSDVSSRIGQSSRRDAFIFVHGYNTSFQDAARRTAQIAYDLKFEGAPVFFSWPSQAAFYGYTVDETNVEFAQSDLKKFIREFAATTPAEKIHLIAHSMGNRAMTRALAELFREQPEIRNKISEIILAAPDIDADVFIRDIAPALQGPNQLITLYASSNDWALLASKKFHGYSRAGDTGDNISIAPGIVTIDSSSIETDFLGHSYFAQSQSIISDIFDMLGGRRLPEERTWLSPVDITAGRYWKFQLSKP